MDNINLGRGNCINWILNIYTFATLHKILVLVNFVTIVHVKYYTATFVAILKHFCNK